MNRPVLDPKEVRTRHQSATQTGAPAVLRSALADIPALLAEIDRLHAAHALTRARYGNLLAAARATLAADHDSEADPLAYPSDAVGEHRVWPPPDGGELAE